MDASIEKQLEELRTKNQLRALTEDESGTGIDRLPAGVFGFTGSPAEDNFPLFNKKDLKSYEAHKLPDGSAILVGFVAQGDKMKLDAGRELVTIFLFPDPQNEANVMVTIPMMRVQSHRSLSQREGKGLELHVGPLN